MTHITIELPADLTREAEQEAIRRGITLSRLVQDSLQGMVAAHRDPDPTLRDGAEADRSTTPPGSPPRRREHEEEDWEADLPPITRSLLGCIKDSGVDERDYYRYLEEKYL